GSDVTRPWAHDQHEHYQGDEDVDEAPARVGKRDGAEHKYRGTAGREPPDESRLIAHPDDRYWQQNCENERVEVRVPNRAGAAVPVVDPHDLAQWGLSEAKV